MHVENDIESGGWLVYLNGIEVPAESCTVDAQVSGIPQASVTFPPDNLIKRIGSKDRVRLTIFYQDIYYTASQDEDPDWRLMFDGEIVDYQYSKTSGGRKIQYTAVDMIATLTKIFPVFVSGVTSIIEKETQTSRNASTAALHPSAQTYSLFTIGLASGEVIRRPYEFVLNIFRLLLGENADSNAQSVVAKQWFQRWVERTRMIRRILPSLNLIDSTPDGTGGFPILKAAQDKKVIDSLSKEGDRIANNVSYYRLIQHLFQRVYYELNPVLAPPIVGVDNLTRYPTGPPSFSDQVDEIDQVDERDNIGNTDIPRGRIVNNLGQHITQPKNHFGLPPRCNVFWPSMVESHSYSENFSTQPTRTYLGNPHIFQSLTGDDGERDILNNAMTQAYPKEAERMLLRRKETADPKVNVDNFLVYPEEFFKGPVYQRLNAPGWFDYVISDKQDPNDARIQKLYTAMEHHRKRLSKRNGGLTCLFNPYVVVGQPCVVIDDVQSNNHLFGYVTSISHTFTQNSMTTRVQYSFAQLFSEFFEELITLRAEFDDSKMSRVDEDGEELVGNRDILFAPIHPIEFNRKRFQRFEDANKHYDALLYQAQGLDNAVFDWREYVGVNTELTYENTFTIVSDDVADIQEIEIKLEDSNAVEYGDGIVPVFDVFKKHRTYMESPRAAMEFVSRPVCTMKEYSDFHHLYGGVEGERLPENPREGKAAPYWVKILQLTQGPGEEPGELTTGGRCEILDVDTVRNWEKRLLRYRQKVYYNDAPVKG